MNTKFRKPLLISVLALALILAACDRPDAANPISSPPTTSAQVVNTQPTPNVQPQATDVLDNIDVPQPNTSATIAPTAIPPLQPQPTNGPQPTAVPVQPTNEPVDAQPTSVPATPQPGCTSPYTVKTGEWLFSIGRTCNVNPYAIAQANNIFPPYYFIYPGQQLTIPGGSVNPQPTAMPGGKPPYIVKPGDNLFRIALMYGVSIQALAAANGITNYNLIYVGQPLTIP